MTDIEINVEQEQNIDVEIENTNAIVTSDHAQLTHLDYASSGHTGFASSVQLTAEQTARESADDTLQDNIDAEATARANAVGGEQTARQNADSTLQNNIDDEEEARISADSELDDKIDAEEERATAKENEIAGNLSSEVTARQNADTTLQTNITNEATARQNADTNESTARANADNLLDGRLDVIEADYLKSSDKTALQSQITANANDIDAIESKIPSGASSVNQLADKSFVNSSIATNTAYFLGTLDVVSDLGLQYKATTSAIVTKLNDYEFTSDPTNNDYVFVVNKDNDNNTLYQRFKYNASETTFLFEYALNNSSFTASQWSAINSGATDILIGKITTNESAIATEITNRTNADDELQDNIDAEETRAKAEEQALGGRLDTIESDYLKASDKTALQNLITAEETRAEEVESGLDTRLDTIEADYLKESDKTALQSQITLNTNARHTHDNKSLLDTYDQTNANITDAVSKKHSHDNKSILDTITQTKLDKIDTNESNIATINNKLDSASLSATETYSYQQSGGIHKDSIIKSQCLIKQILGNSIVRDEVIIDSDCEIISGGDNVWDEKWENGYYTTSDKVSNSNYIRSKNYINVVSGNTYYICSNVSLDIFSYSSNDTNTGTLIGNGVRNTTITIPNSDKYIRFSTATSGNTTYNHDIKISLNASPNKTTYTPHTENTLSQTGEIIRYIGSVDLGELEWTTIVESGETFYEAKTPSDARGVQEYSLQCLSDKYVRANNYTDNLSKVNSICVNSRSWSGAAKIFVHTSSTPTGILNYELATPYTENIVSNLHTKLKSAGSVHDILNNETSYAIERYGYEQIKGDTPYTLVKQYNVSVSSQLQANTETDKAQEKEIQGLQAQIDKLKEQHEDLYVYGIKRELANSNSAWVRTDKSIGLVANATKDGTSVKNDFDNIPLWKKIISVNMNNDGSINAYYGDSNFAFDGSNGEVMTKIPAHYYKRWKENGYEYIQVSESNFTGATKINEYYIGRYTTSSGAHSYSGVSSQVSTTITNFRTQAQNKGSGWQQLDYHIFDLLNLYLVEYADYNIQNILGRGNASNSAQITLGGCDTLGMKSGCLVNDGLHAVIYRGVENIFGNIYQFVDGLNIKDNVAYISYTPSQYAVDIFSGSYRQVGYTNATSNGCTKELGMDNNNQLCALPISVGGSSSTYVSAYYYQNTGNRIALFGGIWYSGANAGVYWALNNDSSGAYSYIGTRLIKIN